MSVHSFLFTVKEKHVVALLVTAMFIVLPVLAALHLDRKEVRTAEGMK